MGRKRFVILRQDDFERHQLFGQRNPLGDFLQVFRFPVQALLREGGKVGDLWNDLVVFVAGQRIQEAGVFAADVLVDVALGLQHGRARTPPGRPAGRNQAIRDERILRVISPLLSTPSPARDKPDRPARLGGP